jgi:hypothetical protein
MSVSNKEDAMRKMMSVVLIALLGAWSGAQAQDAHVALIKKFSGNVKVLREGASLPATPGMQLLASDVISAEAASSAGIVFLDGTRLAVGPATEIEIQRYVFQPAEEKYAFSVFLKKGEAIYTSGKLAKLAPDAVKVSTPRATVGVRGTRFLVQSD